MGLIGEEEIQRIKQGTDLVKYVKGRGVELKRKGKQWVGKCPFHNDRTPSLMVDPVKQVWNCLGACQEGGDVIKLVMKLDGVGFREAVGELGGKKTEELRMKKEKSDAGRTVEELRWLEKYVAFCQRRLVETPRAQAYVVSRGLRRPELWGAWRVGYADGSILEALSPEGREVLKRIGVLTAAGRELLEGCVVFPLFDVAKPEVVNLYGRRVEGEPRADPDDGRGAAAVKGVHHLYLPGERRGVFHPEGVRGSEEVIIVESVIDAAAAVSAGIGNVVALFGINGLTADHLRQMKEWRTRRAVVVLDADEAGRRAIPKLRAELAKLQIESRAVELPAKDIAEFIAGGGTGEELRSFIYKEQGSGFRSQDSGKEAEAAVFSLGAGTARPGEVKETDDGYQLEMENRRYQIRGLTPTNLDRLKVTVRLNLISNPEPAAFHLDTLDLYHAGARERFAAKAAVRLGVMEAEVEGDLLAVIDPLERRRLELKPRAAPTGNAAVAMTPEDQADALEFLKQKDLLDQIPEDLAVCGLVGERAAAQVGYLTLLSRKLPKPLSALVIARSGAGKSSLQDALCGFVPAEDLVRVTRLTGQALFYKDPYSLQSKVLAIAEETGAQQAMYSLRTLASDQRLSTEATRTDPQTGKLLTDHYELYGPVAIIITTTSPEAFDEETRSRFVQLTLDESREQTRAILEHQRQRRTLEGMTRETTAERMRKRHQCVQRLIRPLGVLNPFIDQLRFPDQRLISRREQEKYLTLIDVMALLHQYQRPVKRHGEVEYVEVTRDDIDRATALARQVLVRGFDELAPPVRGMYQAAWEVFQTAADGLGVEATDVLLSRRELREATGWTDWQVRVYCQKLTELEYLEQVSGGNGRRSQYRLIGPIQTAIPESTTFEPLRNEEGGIETEARSHDAAQSAQSSGFKPGS